MAYIKDLEAKIHDAGNKKKVIRITYQDKKDEITVRNVEPYEIKNGKLWAYCRKKKGIRQFNLDRIRGAKHTRYNYFPKWPVKLGDNLEKMASFENPYRYTLLEHLFGSYHHAPIE